MEQYWKYQDDMYADWEVLYEECSDDRLMKTLWLYVANFIGFLSKHAWIPDDSLDSNIAQKAF